MIEWPFGLLFRGFGPSFYILLGAQVTLHDPIGAIGNTSAFPDSPGSCATRDMVPCADAHPQQSKSGTRIKKRPFFEDACWAASKKIDIPDREKQETSHLIRKQAL